MNNKVTILSAYKLIFVVFVISLIFIFKNLILGINLPFNISILFLGLCIYIPILFFIKTTTFIFSPKIILPLWFSLMYYISSIPIYSSNDPRSFFSTLLFDPLDENNILLFYILGLGILLYYFGYSLIDNILKFKYKEFGSVNIGVLLKYKKYFILLYVFSITFRLIGYYMGFLGSLSALDDSGSKLNIPFISIFYFISNSWLIYYFYFATLSFESKKSHTIFIVFIAFELFFMIISGHRRNLIVLLFSYLLAFYLNKGYIPIIKFLKYFVPIIIFVLPFLTIYGYLLPSLENYELSSLLNLVSNSFDLIKGVSFGEMIEDLFFKPLLESFNYFSNVGIAYSEFTVQGEYWGPVGPKNLVDKIVPSSIIDSGFDEREYYQLYADKAMSYSIDYSNLTFTAQSEQMLSFGIFGVLLGMLSQGLIAGLLFRLFNSYRTPFILRLIYLGLLYKFTINFCSGLLVSDLVFPFRLLIYAVIVHIVVKILTNKK